jgi:SH3 domain protein
MLGVLLGLCLIAQICAATEAYVTDSFEVTLRTGPSIDNKIIAMPSSGQRVEVLERNEDWTHVRLAGPGETTKEGWILSRFLITRVPWEVQARSLKQENLRLKERLADTERRLSEASQKEKAFAGKLEETAETLEKVEDKYESLKKGAGEYLSLRDAHKAAQSSLEIAQSAVERLSKENEELRSSQKTRWFATGALVLFCGLILGLVLGRMQRKRRSSYY